MLTSYVSFGHQAIQISLSLLALLDDVMKVYNYITTSLQVSPKFIIKLFIHIKFTKGIFQAQHISNILENPRCWYKSLINVVCNTDHGYKIFLLTKEHRLCIC